MGKHRTSSGLTLVEVLILVFACMMAVAIAISMLAGVKDRLVQVTCGTELAGLGKAMLIYANDHEDALPRAGGRDSQWTARVPDWTASQRQEAFGLAADGTGGEVSVSASMYLLVKYGRVPPESFLCVVNGRPTEKGVAVFRPSLYGREEDPNRFWDFGPYPPLHCSFAYHVPYGAYALTVDNEPGVPVAADRNPWIGSPSTEAREFTQFKPDLPPFSGTARQARHGNTVCHGGDGQSVLFLDSHVEFAKHAYCGLDNDNIYTISSSPTSADPLGTPPSLGSQPAGPKDSLLVNDPVVPRR